MNKNIYSSGHIPEEWDLHGVLNDDGQTGHAGSGADGDSANCVSGTVVCVE